MGVNQVNMNGEELINLTADTVSALNLLEGETAHDASGEAIVGKAKYINPNFVVNSNFKINQRGIRGAFTTLGAYFVDGWKLVEGTVTVNTDGTITLDGTICQFFENPIGDETLAYSSAGIASYDDSAKTYTLTASGETLEWVMLVQGKIKLPFSKPNEAVELLKCQRYFIPAPMSSTTNYITSPNYFYFSVPLPTTMRTTPSFVAGTKIRLGSCDYNNSIVANLLEDSTYSIGLAQFSNGLLVSAIKASHGFSTNSVFLDISAGGLSAEL